jgi:hypothetical protein
MPAFFTPNIEILPQGQRELWPLLAAVPAHFTLYGGTALAIQLGHRESIDSTSFRRKLSIQTSSTPALAFSTRAALASRLKTRSVA